MRNAALEIKGVPKHSQLVKLFGPTNGKWWENEGKSMWSARVPVGMRRIFGRGSFYCNRMMATHASRALALVCKKDLARELGAYGGCYIPGHDVLEHRYGMAVWLVPVLPKFSEKFLNCFSRHGFRYDGARFLWTIDG